MAELLLRGWGPSDVGLVVSSAGTQALVGHGIDRSSASALGQLGIDPSRHRARQFDPWMAMDADLILTAERAHRDLVMTEVPNAFRRTFTMKEFARLSSHVGTGHPKQVIAEMAGIRGIDGPVPDEIDNMPDPYKGRITQAKSIAQQVSDTVHAVIEMLGLRAADAVLPAAGRRPAKSRPRPSPR